MKETLHFHHDSNAREDEKLIALRIRHGWEGYGLFWAIIEVLRQSSNYSCAKDYNIIAFNLRTAAEKVKSIVEEFGLFTFTHDGKRFYSERLTKEATFAKEQTAIQKATAELKSVTTKAKSITTELQKATAQMQEEREAYISEVRRNAALVRWNRYKESACSEALQDDAKPMQNYAENEEVNAKPMQNDICNEFCINSDAKPMQNVPHNQEVNAKRMQNEFCINHPSEAISKENEEESKEKEERSKEEKEKKEEDKEKEKDTLCVSKKKNAPHFSPPTPEEVAAYAEKLGYEGFSPQRFVDFYTSKGWLVGKVKMKDWRAAVRSWHSRSKEETQNRTRYETPYDRKRRESQEGRRAAAARFAAITEGTAAPTPEIDITDFV